MRTVNKIPFCLLGYFFLLALISCKKFVQVDAPPQLIETNQVFSDDKTAVSAVAGLYIQMRNQSLSVTNAGLSVYGGLSSDEIVNTSTSSVADPFSKNALLSTNPTIKSNFWSSAYRNIYQVNAVLDGITHSKALSDAVAKQLTGEMKTVRAFYYFYLVQLFGDVPLVLKTDYRINATMPRTSASNVITQIVSDLSDAKNLLSPAYPTANRARPNKWTASALLARVYLFKKDWANAESEASSIIDSGIYSLNSDLNNVFLPNSSETIWQIVRDQANTSEGAAFIPFSSTARPSYAVTASLLSSFETNDQRRLTWMKANTVAGQKYYYPYKYRVRSSATVSEYEVVVRLSEMYLARAEARAWQNDIIGAEEDLNIIRARAGLSPVQSSDPFFLRDAIYHERRVELFCEWGHRWLDLKRWAIADSVLSPIKGANWQNTDVLYPIPQAEIDRNPSLRQNAGY